MAYVRKSGLRICAAFILIRNGEIMKRIQSACICQTLHFQLKEGVVKDYAMRAVQEEVANYKSGLERSHTKYKILEENTQNDGSIIIKIKKQLNTYDVGAYLD
mgnify:CR=1 FL=1